MTLHRSSKLARTIISAGALCLGSTAAMATPRQCEQNPYKEQLPAGTELYHCNGWYAGLGLGISSLKPRIVNLPETLDQTRDTVTPTIYVGYDLNAHWGLEAHYSDQGQATFESGAAIDYQHMGASLLYHVGSHLPGWNAYGKLGVSQLDTSQAKGRDDGGYFSYEQLESTQLHLGAGIEYMAASMWGVRLEGLSVDKDSNEITLSIMKRFGRSAGTIAAKPAPKPVPAAPAPAPVLPPPPAVCTAPFGVLEGVYFITASAELTEQGQRVLDGLVEQLSPFPGIEIAVRAHTDSRGSDSYNLNLSNLRAASVRQYLQAHGIANVQSQGFGETRPIGDNNTDAGRAQNRRVEIEVLSNECDR